MHNISCTCTHACTQARRQAFVWGDAFQSKMDSGDLSGNKIWMTGFACHVLVSISMPFCYQFTCSFRRQIDRCTSVNHFKIFKQVH